MATTIDYALMAGASYISTRDSINRFPVPETWTTVTAPPNFNDDSSGFEAISFQRSNEIVISYAGTYAKDIGLTGDWATNLALSAGNICDQLRQAADYYLAIKNDPQYQGCTITLTGHSLGGGLASLIAVMFGESATTFDQAPFLASAQMIQRTTGDGQYSTVTSVAQDLRAWLTGRVPTDTLARLDSGSCSVQNSIGIHPKQRMSA